MNLIQDIFQSLLIGHVDGLRNKVTKLIKSQIPEDGTPSVATLGRCDLAVQFHPLGFLCLRWQIDEARSLRVHLWHRKYGFSQKPNWPIHDHIFSFRSAVVVGRIQNKTYALGDAPPKRRWPLFAVTYRNGRSELSRTGQIAGIVQTSAVVQGPDSQYEIEHGILHRSILRSEYAITVLAATKNEWPEAQARVVGDRVNTGLTFDRGASADLDQVVLLKEFLDFL